MPPNLPFIRQFLKRSRSSINTLARRASSNVPESPESQLNQRVMYRHENNEQLEKHKDLEIVLTDELVSKLERLSALRMTEEDKCNLEEDIRLAQHIFEVDVEGIEPLYNISEDYIDCPLRDDVPLTTSTEETLMNARKIMEGFFVAPTVGVVEKQKKPKKSTSSDAVEEHKPSEI